MCLSRRVVCLLTFGVLADSVKEDVANTNFLGIKLHLNNRPIFMTVSHRKAKEAGISYYLRSQDGRPSLDGWQPAVHAVPAWSVAGETRALTMDRLNLLDGTWTSLEDVARFKALASGFSLSISGGRSALVTNTGSGSRVALHDFTLSAPKSVSVVWAFSSSEDRVRIEQAQAAAALSFIEVMSASAYSRRGHGGTFHSPCALVVALFPHKLSRRDDPQLHTHCTFLNVAVRSDGSTGSLETLGMMRNLGQAATAYHEKLETGLQLLGFSVRKKGLLFEIDGVPDEVCSAFSHRRNEAMAFARARLVLEPRGTVPSEWRPSRRLMAQAILRTRPQKRLTEPRDLLSLWLKRAAMLGFDPVSVHGLRCIEQGVRTSRQCDSVPEDDTYGKTERARCRVSM